jgi:energy-coupling factor transport system ATP-binding protein
MSEIGQSVGFVFQNPDHQIFANTVRKEVEFGPRNFDIQESELQTRVDSALQTVGLSEHENADPFNLSKGQRQRVALASILATHPRILIFDEPTTGLDAAQRDSFMSLITRLNQEENLTVIMITHSMQTVARYAPRSIVLRDGSIVYDGSTRALFADMERLEMNNLRPPPVVNLAQKLSSRSEKLSSSLPLSVHEFINCVNDTVSTRK